MVTSAHGCQERTDFCGRFSEFLRCDRLRGVRESSLFMGPTRVQKQELGTSHDGRAGVVPREGETMRFDVDEAEATVRDRSGPARCFSALAHQDSNELRGERRYFRHHPVIGWEYIPGLCLSLRRPDGKSFTLEVNAAGIRSSREYALAIPAGVYRILVFGDSFADGLYQCNEHRFSELMEQRNPGLEVVNFSLPACGTDQQLLAFEEVRDKYEHDLIVVLPQISGIRRNLMDTIGGPDPQTGRAIVRPKPQFSLVRLDDGTESLELRNVPVPDQRQELDDSDQAEADTARPVHWFVPIRRALGTLPFARRIKRALESKIKRDPFPEYRDPQSYDWRLMAAILRRFAKGAKGKPCVIVPLFPVHYVSGGVPRSYWDRFASLADGRGTYVIDVYPRFTTSAEQAAGCFMMPHDGHLSDFGHAVLADAIEAELRRLDLLPGPNRRA